VIEAVANGPTIAVPSYLRRSDDRYGGTVIGDPRREDTAIDLQEALVVEFYAR
jgi:hypothetical protein